MASMSVLRIAAFAAACVFGVTTATTGLRAAVISTVHYQEPFIVTCVSAECEGVFKRPGTSRQLNVTWISCILFGDANSVVERVEVHLERGDGSVLIS